MNPESRFGKSLNAKYLRRELRRTIAKRRSLLAQYEDAQAKVALAGRELALLLGREDFVALLRAEGIATVPAPLMQFIWCNDDEEEA